tara:strand:- start:3894 stop:4259 length:366 start_codon:yes stop_codon:yes gene_type:complete
MKNSRELITIVVSVLLIGLLLYYSINQKKTPYFEPYELKPIEYKPIEYVIDTINWIKPIKLELDTVPSIKLEKYEFVEPIELKLDTFRSLKLVEPREFSFEKIYFPQTIIPEPEYTPQSVQ